MKKWLFVLFTILGLSAVTANICFASSEDDQAVHAVIVEWFSAMKSQNITQAETYLAPQFRSIHTDGKIRDRAQEITLMKNLNMKNYDLSNFEYSSSGDTVVVTFKDKGMEQIDNKNIGAKSMGRMAVLQKQKDKWMILAYANLDTIG